MTYAKHLASTWSRYEKRHPNWEESLASQPAEEPFLYTVPCTKCNGFGKDTCYSNCFVCDACKATPHIANFFAAVAAVAEQRVMAKKAAAEAKKQAALSIIGKAVFKATGATLFGIEDRRGKDVVIYHLTFIAGKVRGCVNATTGEECSGRRWSGRCCHEDRVMAYEAAREAELPPANEMYRDYERSLDEQTWDEERRAFEDLKKEVARIEQRHDMGIVAELLPEMATHDDMTAHIEDSIESGELDWIDAERAAWQNATPEQRRAMYSNAFDLSYGDVA